MALWDIKNAFTQCFSRFFIIDKVLEEAVEIEEMEFKNANVYNVKIYVVFFASVLFFL